MLHLIHKYLRRSSKEATATQQPGEGDNMISPCTREASGACAQGCCPAPFLGLIEPARSKGRSTTTTTTRASRSDFARATTSTLFPNTYFTNHESLPALPDALSAFTAAYPQYGDTQQADRIRDQDYCHLSNHTCLDYAGVSLFSHAQMHSSSPPSPSSWLLQPPFFSISYKSVSLKTQLQYGSQDTGLESAMRRRIMSFLSLSEDDYGMVCTANRTTAFRLLAETYPFHSNKRLLTVYDHESEAVSTMAESARKRGAKVLAADFSWPSLRIHSPRLRKILRKRKKTRRGLLVFPLQSRMTGARYPYRWMSFAQENGWHVILDASALGPKDLDTLGLSLIHPDFIICSFFKVFGENPSGFAALFVKRSSGAAVLETSVMAKSIGIVSIVPARRLSDLPSDLSGTDLEAQPPAEADVETASSISDPIPSPISNGSSHIDSVPGGNQKQKQKQLEVFEQGETSELREEKGETPSEIVELEESDSFQAEQTMTSSGGAAAAAAEKSIEIECRGLDHADSLGLLLISSRLRYITNWLVIALLKLRHPNSENGHSLVKIYGPRIKFDRGPSLAFNVFDWKGEKVEPALVQKLADRSNISLSCGTLRNICFSDKYEADRDAVLETTAAGGKRKESISVGIAVVNASLGFVTDFGDAYKLWAFVAKFLDADFVEKEKWRYMALNQRMIEV